MFQLHSYSQTVRVMKTIHTYPVIYTYNNWYQKEISYFINLYFCHNAKQDWYSHFNLYSWHVSAIYSCHQVFSLCLTVHCIACLSFKIKSKIVITIHIKTVCPIKFSKNGFNLFLVFINVIFGGMSVFLVVRWCWCVCWFLLYMSLWL
jgi:hypothetical protein